MCDINTEIKEITESVTTETEEKRAPLSDDELLGYAPAVEAIIFAAGFPVRYDKIAQACEITLNEVKRILELDYFSYEGRGIRLIKFSDSCQLCSNEIYERTVKIALGMRINGGLSASSLETLAIIAYNQPVTRAFIDQVRGVDCSYAITSLTEKQLIEVTGRLDVPGHPNLYGTTETFLRCFGLGSTEELPKNEILEVVNSKAAEEKDEETSAEPVEETSENYEITENE